MEPNAAFSHLPSSLPGASSLPNLVGFDSSPSTYSISD
ncbi:rCG37790 [Rattus norvegicus]|uniref:RCG37790 n=1 Tax=Rattus norvegicus TaxID=10116 RepID=A6JF73_RAT|nr:rCG37790 [Rattus norvegicus]